MAITTTELSSQSKTKISVSMSKYEREELEEFTSQCLGGYPVKPFHEDKVIIIITMHPKNLLKNGKTDRNPSLIKFTILLLISL